ncbi:MAG: hypothetical protein OYH77_07440 [Pseudomonadota bacterium]|nr:hypothetical protein [Pseudomonadota bacterium]
MILRDAASKLDLFKGRRSKNGKIVRVRSVGSGYPILSAYQLLINGFALDSHFLIPEADINADNDYLLCYRSHHSKRLQQAGIAHLMRAHNAGLIQLEWDIYGNKDIYLNLSTLGVERRAA